MNRTWYRNDINPGSGWKNPRLDILDISRSEIPQVVSFPELHRIYAVDINPENDLIAIGSKDGIIHLIDNSAFRNTDEFELKKRINHGAPILSVCWASGMDGYRIIFIPS